MFSQQISEKNGRALHQPGALFKESISVLSSAKIYLEWSTM